MTIQLTKPTPLYAAVGAGDALVAKVRGGEVPKVNFDVDTLLKDLKTVQGQAKSIRLSDLPRQFKQVSLSDLQAQVRSLQVQLKSVQGQAQHAATDTVGQLGKAYVDFAKRGEEVVNHVRKRDVVGDVRSNVDDVAGKARAGAADVIGDVKGRVSKAQEKVEPESKPTSAAKSTTKTSAAKKSTATSTKQAPAKKATAKKSTAKATTKKPTSKKA